MNTGALYDAADRGFAEQAHSVYRRLRDEHPVYKDPQGRFYALSRFADVREAALNWRRFSSTSKAEAQFFKPAMAGMDPPRHTRLRSLIAGEFTARRIAGLEDDVRALTRLERLEREEPWDAISSFAAVLPSMVIGRLIGVPRELWPECHAVTDAIMRVRSVEDYAEPASRAYALFQSLVDERRRRPADDLLSALIAAELDGQRLTDDDLVAFGFILLVGGNDTTANLIGNGLELLARHPDQRSELLDDPALIPAAIEECLRIAAPTHSTPRTATCDIELHGTTIPRGARVLLLWASANLDEREFPDPARFDIHRSPNRHLAFAVGPHFCIGAPLARLEARVAFEELLPRLGDYELASDPRRIVSSIFNGFESLPLRLPTATSAR